MALQSNLEKLQELQDEVNNEEFVDLENRLILQTLLELELGQIDSATEKIKELSESIVERLKSTEERPQKNLLGEYMVFRHFMSHSPEAAEICKPYKQAILDRAIATHARNIIGHISYDVALNFALQNDAMKPGTDVEFEHWLPVHQNVKSRNNAIKSWWATEEDKLLQLSGPARNIMCFKYPIVGNFRFSVDAFEGSWLESDIGYDGVIVEANSRRHYDKTSIQSASGDEQFTRAGRMTSGRTGFNRQVVERIDDQYRHWSRGLPDISTRRGQYIAMDHAIHRRPAKNRVKKHGVFRRSGDSTTSLSDPGQMARWLEFFFLQ